MKHRIFISIDIPGGLKNVTEAHIDEFYKNNLARVAERENWHITVVFCGYLDDKKLNELKNLAGKIASETKSFELVPDKIVFAPPDKKPRMVWLVFKHSPAFLNLSKKLQEFNDGLKPLPHLTLVRFEEKHYPDLKKLLAENGIDLKDETKSFMVKSINIMESHLSRSGPKYELLCRNCLR